MDLEDVECRVKALEELMQSQNETISRFDHWFFTVHPGMDKTRAQRLIEMDDNYRFTLRAWVYGRRAFLAVLGLIGGFAMGFGDSLADMLKWAASALKR